MSGAPILMIDELSLGLAPIIAGEFADSLRRLAETGLAVVLVEQYLHLALRISDRVSVVERGRIVLSGTAEQARDEVIALQNHYLGDADAGVRSS